MRVMYWFIKSHLEAAYLLQSSKTAAFLPYIASKDGEKTLKDLIIPRINEVQKITHLEVELTKEASKELLGARTAFRNSLAVSDLGKWPDCCTNDKIPLGVTKGQLNIYLRPPK
jgi:hypothetical protein